jgi:hypothetical protein
LNKLPQSTTTTEPRTNPVVTIPFKIEFRSSANLVDLIASTNVSALQEVRIGQAALPIGKRNVMAVETQMMSEQYEALKSIQALAGTQERHVHNSIGPSFIPVRKSA